MHHHNKDAVSRAHEMLKTHRYAHGGAVHTDEPQDKALVRKAIRQHETAEHGGHHVALKLRRGGHVPGDMPEDRPDRRARGGSVKPKIGAVNINIKHGGEAEKQQAMQQGMQIGAKLGAAQAGGAPHPPMGGPPMPPHPMGPPPPGGPPMGGAPPGMPPRPMPPQMAAHGGHITRRDERGRWRGGVA